MRLPVMPPVLPMLAKSVPQIPDGMQYEGKWDGFRAIVFRDSEEIEIGSRNGRPLTRYFPELAAGLLRELPDRCVLDGEIVIIRDGRLHFDALQERIHPAASRVKLLAETTPALFIAFDVLALDDRALLADPLRDRRAALETALTSSPGGGRGDSIRLAPATTDIALARDWFDRFEGAGLDGIVAKPLDGRYEPDVRAMFKIKHERTADCVLAGFRWHKSGQDAVGSLLLGLFNTEGNLQHVGVCASFPMKRRRELAVELAPLRENAMDNHPWSHWAETANDPDPPDRLPGAVSRWNAKKDLSWEPLRPERVLEVAYDHMEGDRFRHTTQFRRWRPDRDPQSCTYAQLEEPVRFDLAEVLGGRVES